MQVICDCGKKFYLADDSGSHVCDRCGQTLGSHGSSASRPGKSLPGHAHQQEAPIKNLGKAGMTMPIEHLDIASDKKSHFRLGCAVVLLAALALGVASDFYLNPAVEQPCGHVAKDAYIFGLYKGAHRCEAIDAVRYLDRMRRAALTARKVGRALSPSISVVSVLPDVGAQPDGPYEYDCDRDFSLVAIADVESHLPSFHLSIDGTLRRSTDGEAGPGNEAVHVFE